MPEVQIVSFIYGEASQAKGELGLKIAQYICRREVTDTQTKLTAGHLDTGKIIFRSTARGALLKIGYTVDEFHSLPETEQKRVIESFSALPESVIDNIMSGITVQFQVDGRSVSFNHGVPADPEELKKPIVSEIAGIFGHNQRIQDNAANILVRIIKESGIGICIADGRTSTVKQIAETEKIHGIKTDLIRVTAPESTRNVIAAWEVYRHLINPELPFSEQDPNAIETVKKYIIRRSVLDNGNTYELDGSNRVDRRDGLESIPIGLAWNTHIGTETEENADYHAPRLINLYHSFLTQKGVDK